MVTLAGTSFANGLTPLIVVSPSNLHPVRRDPVARAGGFVTVPVAVHPLVAVAFALDPVALAPGVAGAVPFPVAGLPDLLVVGDRRLWRLFGFRRRRHRAGGGLVLHGLASGKAEADEK